MRKTQFYMLAFRSTLDAIRSQKALEPHLKVTVMPTLRQVSASCGMALRIEVEEWPRLQLLEWDRDCATPYYVGEQVEAVAWDK